MRQFLSSYTNVTNKTLLNYHIVLSSMWHWAAGEQLVERNIIRGIEAPKPEKREIQPLAREPTIKEVAEVLEVPCQEVENRIRVALWPLSLEMPTNDDEDSMLGDFIEVNEVPPPDEIATYNLLCENLREALNELPPREVRILQLRYGLLDGQTYTLEQVGSKMGVTHQRIRQIETQALNRLRLASIRHKLHDYLDE